MTGPEQEQDWPGHSVLQVPVPALEPYVRGRHAAHDPAWVSRQRGFVHAHVTLLGPFVTELDAATESAVAEIAASTTAFDATLARVEVFPDGLLHLVPEPDDGFRRLTARLVEAFPEHPPYAGRYGAHPHLTLDRLAPTADPPVTLASTVALLGDLLPARVRADRIELVWWQADRLRTLRTWPLRDPQPG